ncbi:hypothetical protein Q0812_05900 [Brevundimonas sp. 2R-24]|uniref:DUF1579 domain-containing protein n=1 Tax=Peiella sedimenti TaxID=3061083 RepID=A0ABT8SK64_9CAUL|nr:hypothetical protein [Caulobacteraceae bacterium XZ-24]
MFAALIAAAALSASGCDFGSRTADAPAELDQYAFLIGDHEIQMRFWRPEDQRWGDRVLRARWVGRWVLDGHAIADEWFGAIPEGASGPSVLGYNVRMWDAANGRWSNMWMTTAQPQVQDLPSEMRDGRMVMWQAHPAPSPEWKAEFEVHADGSWTRTQYVSDGQGGWTPQFKLDARRRTTCG